MKHRAAAWIISHLLVDYFGVREAQCFLRHHRVWCENQNPNQREVFSSGQVLERLISKCR